MFLLVMSIFEFSKEIDFDPDISIMSVMLVVELFTSFPSYSTAFISKPKPFELSNFLKILAKGWKSFLGVETSDLFCLYV